MDWATFCAQNLPTPHTITVEAFAGTGAYGDAYATPTTVTPCMVEHVRRRVKVQTADAAGAIVTSSVTVFCPPGTVAPPGSRITLTDGTVTKVLSLDTLDSAGHDIPSHVELSLE